MAFSNPRMSSALLAGDTTSHNIQHYMKTIFLVVAVQQ